MQGHGCAERPGNAVEGQADRGLNFALPRWRARFYDEMNAGVMARIKDLRPEHVVACAAACLGAGLMLRIRCAEALSDRGRIDDECADGENQIGVSPPARGDPGEAAQRSNPDNVDVAETGEGAGLADENEHPGGGGFKPVDLRAVRGRG